MFNVILLAVGTTYSRIEISFFSGYPVCSALARLLREAGLLLQPGARAPRSSYGQLSETDADIVFAKVTRLATGGRSRGLQTYSA